MSLAGAPVENAARRAEQPGGLRALLTGARTIAVFGASNEPWRPSFGIMSYLQRAGYKIIPVNPFLVGESVHGEPFRASLRDIDEPVDLVNVFRRPDAVEAVVDDAIAVGAPALWLQIGVRNETARSRAEAAGITVVMDRCISVEHARLCR
jgi:predicted CoA-binding protein